MSTQHNADNYYLPGLSHWPVTASAAVGLLGFGAAIEAMAADSTRWVGCSPASAITTRDGR